MYLPFGNHPTASIHIKIQSVAYVSSYMDFCLAWNCPTTKELKNLLLFRSTL
jgi:hypothetical protein